MRRLSPAGLAKFSEDWDLRWLRIFRGGPKERLHPGSRETLMARTAEKQKKRRRKVRSAPKSVKTAPPAGSKKSIDLYYWPTPNGWKITIMLEECALPYKMIPVDISKGDQFKPHFLAISPNNRMPAIVDYDGPNGKPISIFESGAIVQYLGPKAGEANHFRNYAPEQLPYAIKRFSNEMNRIYDVMNRRLEDREFLAGKYSIADIACIGWASRAERHGHDLSAFANVRRWLETVLARPAVKRGLSVKVEAAFHVDLKDPKVRAVLFNQRAR